MSKARKIIGTTIRSVLIILCENDGQYDRGDQHTD